MGLLVMAVIALFSVMVGAAVGVLTWLSCRDVPAAILAAMSAVGGTFAATCLLVLAIRE